MNSDIKYVDATGIQDFAKATIQGQMNTVYDEVIDQIELVPLRDRLHYLVDKRFRGELNKCEGCKLCR